MQVDGIDMSMEAYRVSFDAGGRTVRGLVPEGLVMEMLSIGRRPGHEEVYRWLARNSAAIEAALLQKSRGTGPVKAPFDRLSLAEET